MDGQPLLKRILLIGFLVAALTSLPLVFSVTAAPGAQECSPPECPEYPPEEPPPGGESAPPGGGSWSGYSDGRLNPDMAEYYSVWCANDLIEVWGGKPAPQLIVTFALVDVLQLGDVGSLNAGSITLSRTGDTIVLSGNNGNNAPNPGSKWFSLNECLTRNGRTPELPANLPQPPNPPPAENPNDEAALRREAEDRVAFCFDGYEFLQDGWLLAGCLNDALTEYADVLNGSEISSLVLMILCLNIIVGNGIVPIGIVVFLGWHRRWLRKQKTLR
jgi:hypothetical protein